MNSRELMAQNADIPRDATRAVVEITVQVPEGDWQLAVHVNGSEQTQTLHCGGGKCAHVLTVDTGDSGCVTPWVSAGVYLKSEPDFEGCGQPPEQDVVPVKDRERLFDFRFALKEVWWAEQTPACADAGWPDAGEGDSVTGDAAEDASFRDVDAEVDVDAGNTHDAGDDAAELDK